MILKMQIHCINKLWTFINLNKFLQLNNCYYRQSDRFYNTENKNIILQTQKQMKNFNSRRKIKTQAKLHQSNIQDNVQKEQKNIIHQKKSILQSNGETEKLIKEKLQINQFKLRKAYLSTRNSHQKNNSQQRMLEQKLSIFQKSRQPCNQTFYAPTLPMYPMYKAIQTSGIKFPKAKRHLSQSSIHCDQPSPLDYAPESYDLKNKKSFKFSFGKEQKFFQSRKEIGIKKNIPGPGTYQNIIQLSGTKNGEKFPISTRKGPEKQGDVPAVGLYDIGKQYFKHKVSVKFTQAKRRSLTNHSIGPAPNRYFPEKIMQSSFRHTFTKQTKQNSPSNKIPGVGQYNIQKFVKRHSPHAFFPTHQRRNDRNDRSYTQKSLDGLQKDKQINNRIEQKISDNAKINFKQTGFVFPKNRLSII